MKGVSIIIPTYNGGEIFKKSLVAVQQQKYHGEVQIIIIDSGSTDGTYELAMSVTTNVIRINQNEFHHSRTRNLAATQAIHPYIVLMVQDAIPLRDNWLDSMVKSIELEDVAAVCIKQVPHKNADLYAKFMVDNHADALGHRPVIQSIKCIEEFNKLPYDKALQRVRFDNVCALYKKEILLSNPFPMVPYAEDLAWAFEIMKKGYKVKYDTTIEIAHSHNRTREYHFRRAIVDNINCIEILGRSPQDLPLLPVNDLIKLSELMGGITKDMYEKVELKTFCAQPSRISMLYSKLRKYRIVNLIIRRIFNRLIQQSMDSSIKKQAFQMQMEQLLNQAKQKYPDAKSSDFYQLIDNLAAVIVGCYWGKVYASYKLRGNIPHDIEELICPYLGGV